MKDNFRIITSPFRLVKILNGQDQPHGLHDYHLFEWYSI